MNVKSFSAGALSTIMLMSAVAWLFVPERAEAVRTIAFPVIGSAQFSNDFYAPRASGQHSATDIFAKKMQPLVAAVDGVVSFVAYPQPSWGYSVSIRDSDGYVYRYIHMNNDNPGTDDGQGGPTNAYAADMKSGNPVVKGQLLGYVGDSGNAETTPPHLHFEIIDPNGSPVNPYDSLRQAQRLAAPVAYPQLPSELLPYGPAYMGGINIARGNFDADPESEIITGAGIGGGPHVRVFDDDRTFLGPEFFAYHASFPGGVDVAAGDVNGDGTDEIITAAGPGGGPHVRIFTANGTELGGFYAYNPYFNGGVRVTAGDVDGDGTDEIITGPLSRGGPHVRVFRLNGTEVAGFYGFNPAFGGGIDVAAADVTGTSAAEIIVSAGPGGGPHVRVLSGNGADISGFYAYHPNFTGGVRVSAGNSRISSTKSEILTVPSSAGGPHLRMFDAAGALVSQTMFFEEWWGGVFDVGAGYDDSRAAAGTNRRATIRNGLR